MAWKLNLIQRVFCGGTMNIQQALKERIKLQGMAWSTYKSYWHWCSQFFTWCADNNIGKETRAELAVEQWLSWLANSQKVAAKTQNGALQAVCYFYREVKKRPLNNVQAIRAKPKKRVPVVVSVEDVAMLFAHLDGINLLACQLMYGCGLRIGEVLRLRIKDISCERKQLHVHDSKGGKGRHTGFPEVLHEAVNIQIDSVRLVWESDLRNNPGGVSLPDAWRRKSSKSAKRFAWYYLFPSSTLSRLDDGPICRHHRHAGNISRAIREAVDCAGIPKRITAHTLRHAYATHANEQGVDVTNLQQLLGHTNIETTMGYVHANKDRVTASYSPLVTLQSALSNPKQFDKEQPKLRVYKSA